MWFWVIVIALVVGYFLWKSAQKREEQERTRRSGGDDESFTITIHTNYPQAPTKRNRGGDARWLLPGDTLEVAGYSITAGLVYAADYRPGSSDRWSDPSLINTRLPVADFPTVVSEDIGYWPTYLGLSEAHRAGYLQWLADGRNTPGVNTGYLFIFFYGLEKRAIDELIVQGTWNEELDLITGEVVRLRELYQESRSFQGYTGNFLGLLACSKAILTGDRVELRSTLASRWDVPLEVKLGLGQFAAAGEPIPGNWALQWAYSSPSMALRTPARRCQEEFESLFLRLYKREHGEGIVIAPNKTPISIEYQAASLAISCRPFRLPTSFPDVTVLKRPADKLKALVEECTDALDEYSRALGRKSAASLKEYLPALLPQELLGAGVSGVVSRVREWLDESLAGDALHETTAGELISEFKGVIPEELSKKKWELTSLLLSKLGYGVEPDPRYGGRSPDLADTVCIFREEWAPGRRLSAEFNACAASLPFAVMVSSTDGVDETELGVISRRFSHLANVEKKRLEARLRVLLSSPPAVESLRGFVSGLNEQQKAAIARYLLLVAAADGRITQEEIRALQKTYRALELPPEAVHSDIHELITGESGAMGKEPVTVREARRRSPSYELPPETETEEGVIILDAESIRKKRQESEAVVALLEQVLAEDELQKPYDETDADEDALVGEVLDDVHLRLLMELLRYEQIPAERWSQMCREVGLLSDAAIEVINELIMDTFEDADVLIEKSDPLRVNPETAKLVRGLYE